MIINRIEALNYRSLRYVSQNLTNFQVLVGPNAAGKSTFLDTVGLLGDFVRHGLGESLLFSSDASQGRARRFEELIFNQQGESFEIAIDLQIPEDLRCQETVYDKTFHYDLARYEVEFGLGKEGGLEIRAETLWIIDSSQSKPHLQAKDKLSKAAFFPIEPQPPVHLTSRKKNPFGWRTVAKKLYESGDVHFRAESGEWNVTFHYVPDKSVITGLLADIDRFPIALWVRKILFEGIRVLALNSTAMRRPVSPSSSRRFSMDGANLPTVIQDLARSSIQSYQDWVAHIQTILPNLSSINVVERPEDRHLYLALKYDGMPEPVPSWLVSDGTLRLLALTLLAYLPEQDSIYLIEEPENGIHPKAVEGVFQSLSSVYQGQVLVATHSPLFLGLAEPSQLLCFAKNPSGAVDIVSGDKHPALQNWRGEMDLSTLYAAGVLG